MGEIGDAAGVSALRDALAAETGSKVRLALIRALLHAGERNEKVLTELLDSKDARMREAAVRGLAGRGSLDPWPWPEPGRVPSRKAGARNAALGSSLTAHSSQLDPRTPLRLMTLPSRLLALAVALVVPVAASAQQGAREPAGGGRLTATAARAEQAPAIDGREDDPVWRAMTASSEFLEFQPTEGKAPRFRTEFKAAYDDRHLYVFVRAHDAHPDSIMSALTRRDVRWPSDQLKLMVDAYNDRGSGFEFAVNRRG